MKKTVTIFRESYFLGKWFFDKVFIINEGNMKRIAKFLCADNYEQRIQDWADGYCHSVRIPKIKLFFSNAKLSGTAFYQTQKIKGGKINTPVSITIGEWNAIKSYPDEWIYALAHELAHHELNVKKNSLSHTKEQDELTQRIEKEMKMRFATTDKKRIMDKINYWKTHKDEIIKFQKEINSNFDYDKELQKMVNKL
jgi:hypothetical protein